MRIIFSKGTAIFTGTMVRSSLISSDSIIGYFSPRCNSYELQPGERIIATNVSLVELRSTFETLKTLLKDLIKVKDVFIPDDPTGTQSMRFSLSPESDRMLECDLGYIKAKFH